MRQALFVLFLSVLFFLIPNKTFAVTISLGNYPASISSDIFSLEASISGATNATNYLRVDLYKEGTSNYFGETYNGSDWYFGSDGKSYLPVQVQNSTASAVIYAQIGNPSANSYPGPGLYKLRVRRYTSSGSPSSNDTQVPVDVQINYSVPTPTATETPAPITTPTNTLTSTPTITTTTAKTPTPSVSRVIVTSTPVASPTKQKEEIDVSLDTNPTQIDIQPMVLAESTTSSDTVLKKPIISDKNLFLVGILVFSFSAGLLYFRFTNH